MNDSRTSDEEVNRLKRSLKPGDKIRHKGKIFTLSRNHHPDNFFIECTDEGGSGFSLLPNEVEMVSSNENKLITKLLAALKHAHDSEVDGWLDEEEPSWITEASAVITEAEAYLPRLAHETGDGLLLLITQMLPYERDADDMDAASMEARASIIQRAEAYLRSDNERAFRPAQKAADDRIRRPTGQCSWGCYYSEDGKLVRDSACTVHGASSENGNPP